MSEIQFGDLNAFRNNKALFNRYKPQQSIPLVKQDLRLPPYHYIQKYAVVIPPKEIEKLGWKEGEELEPEIKDGELIIKHKKK